MNLTLLSDGSELLRYRDPSVSLYTEPGCLSQFTNMEALCHWHEEVELLIPLKGHLCYRVNGKLVAIQPGNAIFVNARRLHYGFSADGTDCQFFCIVFSPQLFCANQALQRRYISPILNHSGIDFVLLEQRDPLHRSALEPLQRLAAAHTLPLKGRELEVSGLLAQFWQRLYDLLCPSLDCGAALDPDAQSVHRMLDFIQQHYAEPISLKQVAQSGQVCRSKCCRLFRQYLGHTVTGYLQTYRLEQALTLLRESSLSISEISYACGFCSASYFTELLTRYKGCSPTAYRKLLR